MKMATKAKIGLGFTVSWLIGAVVVIILGLVSSFTEKDMSYSLITVVGILLYQVTCKVYPYDLAKVIMTSPSRKHSYTRLTDAEKEMVEDAKDLIRKVNGYISIANFTVYKYERISVAGAFYNKDTAEQNIYVSFEKWTQMDKDVCFMAVLYAILCAQNDSTILKSTFQIGLRQLFAEWLIVSYSEKYKIPTKWEFFPSEKEVVRKILQESGVNMKEAFLHYIDFQPEFFKNFVPKKYFRR